MEDCERFFRLITTIPCALYDYVRWPDGRNQFVYMSPHCERIFEIKAERIIENSQVLWSMVHPDDVARLKAEDRAANESRTMFQSELRIVFPDGRIKWIQMKSMPSTEQLDTRDLWSGIILDIDERKQAEIKRDQLVLQLENALSEIKTLQGLLPICSNCKKIRNEEGTWEMLEAYLTEHSDANFTHSLCPDCLKALYPGMDLGSK